MKQHGAGLVLLRHATCTVPDGHCLGWWDLPLDAAGRQAVCRLRSRWQGAWPDNVVSSDLLRARQTAELLCHDSATHIVVDSRLREAGMGIWEGKAWDDLYRAAPDLLNRWGRQWIDFAPEGGESGRDLYQRIADWHADTQALLSGSTLVVGHAGSLGALVAVLTGQGPEAIFRYPLDHCAPWQLAAWPIDKDRSPL